MTDAATGTHNAGANARPRAGPARAPLAQPSLPALLIADLLRVLMVLRREAPERVGTTIGMVVLATVLHVLTVFVLATDAVKAAETRLDGMDLATFATVLALFVVAFRASARHADATIEVVTAGLVKRHAGRVLSADLADLERAGADAVMTGLTRDVTGLSGALPLVISAIRTFAFLAFAYLLIATNSPPMGLAIAGLVGLLVWLNRGTLAVREAAARRAATAEAQVAVHLGEALTGARELSLNAARRSDLYDNHLMPAVTAVARARRHHGNALIRGLSEWRSLWFVLIGIASFILPEAGVGAAAGISAVLIVFCRVPMNDLNFFLDQLATARAAADRLAALEEAFPERDSPPVMAHGRQAEAGQPVFGRIVLEDVTCFHESGGDDAGFLLGPLSLEIRAGETVLISGPNGAGKSTLLRLVSGLAAPASGRIEIDGVAATPRDLRARTSAVFAEFHTFSVLRGAPDPDPGAIDAMLHDLDLAHRVRFVDGRFTTLALSSGERRRLALVAALAERRPILICDEWTADQAPEFRRRFFAEMLPAFRARGLTVIAVTHDTEVPHVADRHIRIVDGRVVAPQAG